MAKKTTKVTPYPTEDGQYLCIRFADASAVPEETQATLDPNPSSIAVPPVLLDIFKTFRVTRYMTAFAAF